MCEEKNGLRNLNRAIVFLNWSIVDFSSGSDDKESAYNAGNSGLIPGLGRSPGRGNDKPLQYSCLENSVDRGAWRATVHGVAKSRTRLRDLHTHTHTHTVDLQCCVTLRCTAQWFKHIFVSMYLFIPFHILSSYATAATAKSLQSCPTLCDPTDGSPPGSPIPGILQERTLEWVAISFSNAWKWEVKLKLLSRVWLLATPWTAATRLLCPWDFPGKSTGVGCHCLLR